MKNTMKKLFALMMAVMMCVSLTGCGEKEDPKPVAEFKDTFTYADGAEPSSLDLANAGDSVTAFVTNQTSYGLFHIGPDGSMIPDQVQNFEVSEDGLTYTFHLSENKWSDGQPVVAGDYVYGVKHALSLDAADCMFKYFIYNWIEGTEQFQGGGATADMDNIGVEAPDDNTLVFHLVMPCPYFTGLLAAGVFFPCRADYAVDGDYTWANDPKVPTSGPYHYVSVNKAEQIVMEKNEYWCNADQVTTKTLVCNIVEDMDAQLIQFQAGEIDFATSVDATTCSKLFDEEFQVTGAVNYYVSLNCYDCEVLQNRDVRRALQLGIDRQLICDALDAGSTYYPLSSFIPDGMPGISEDWNDEAGKLVYTDYEEAKALLAKAGYDKPDAEGYVLALKYSYNATTMHNTIAEVLVSELAKIGVKLELETSELRTFFSNRSNGAFELARGAYSADYMDPSIYLDLLLKSRQSHVTVGDEHYDEMIEEANTMTGTERLQKLHDAEKYIIEEYAACIPLFGYGDATLVKKGTTGIVSSPQANAFLWYVKVPE